MLVNIPNNALKLTFHPVIKAFVIFHWRKTRNSLKEEIYLNKYEATKTDLDSMSMGRCDTLGHYVYPTGYS
jgi:hypothetical protein